MKTKLTRKQAKEKVEEFFSKADFSADEVRKIKRIAMKFNIKLGKHRQKFCRKCLAKLKGKTRVSKTHKTIECGNCGYKNKFRLS